MPENWTAEHPPHTEDANRMAKLTEHLLGNKFSGINSDVMRAFSLYNYLVKHRDTPTATLHQNITENGRPIFTKEQIDAMKKTINSHMEYPYVQRLLTKMSGGAKKGAEPKADKNAKGAEKNAKANGAEAKANEEGKEGEEAPAKGHPLDSDPSRSKFWDRMIRKIMHPIVKRIPEKFDGLLWYTFILYSLEQNELIGPFLSTALDTITLSLPILADLVTDTAGELIGLAPIPYAGKLGNVIGYALSLMFVFMAVLLNMSRKHFGTAFITSLEAIPMIGDVASDGAQKFEMGAERYLQNRKRLLKTVDAVSPTAEDIANYYSPSDKIDDGPAPSLDPGVVMPAIKKDIMKYVLESSGLDDVINQIPDTLPTAESLEAMATGGPPAEGAKNGANAKNGTNKANGNNAANGKNANAKNGANGNNANAKNGANGNNANAKNGKNAAEEPKKGGTRKKRCLQKSRKLNTRKRQKK